MSDMIHLLKKARGFEKAGDFDQESKILKGFWNDFSREPETNSLAPTVEGEVYRLCGKFLSAYGKAKSKSEYQELGKILLTKAVNIFEEEGEYGKAALAKCQIALIYYYVGRPASADAILSEAERYFSLDKNNPYYLEIKINHLIALSNLGKINDCLKIIEFLSPRLENSTNSYLKLMFFNQCGFVLNNAEQHRLAEKHFRQALEIAESCGNERAVGQISNNLAYTCWKNRELYKAYDHARRAIIIAEELKDAGWLANYLDTKASIELELGDAERALVTIERSIEILISTGEAISLIESLWTKIEILFALDKSEKATLVFSKLSETAISAIGEAEAEFYAQKFTEKLYSHKKSSENKIQSKISNEVEIVRFIPTDNIRIENLLNEGHRLFFVPAKKAGILGFDDDLIVCACFRKKPNPIVMVKEGKEYILGDLVKDEAMDLTVLYTGKNQTDPICVSPDEAEIEGSVGAIALAKTLNENYLIFENLER